MSASNFPMQEPVKSTNYNLNYSLTRKVWNSNDFIAKIARYSILGIALTALIETIVEVIKIPLKFIENTFGLSKSFFFQSKAQSSQITPLKVETKSAKEEVQKITNCNENKSKNESDKIATWKKGLLIGGSILGVCLLVWGIYTAYTSYNKLFQTPIEKPTEDLEEINSKISSKSYPNISFFETPKSPQEAQDMFVDHYEKMQQCPSMKTFIEDQQTKGYWGWSLDNMKRLFGSERDLGLKESRIGFYHGEIQKNIPNILIAHPDNHGGPLEKLPKKVAQDLSEFRNTAREYTRLRSCEEMQRWLEKHEPRNKGFDFYWDRYGQNPKKIIEGTMKSNSFYDNPYLLSICDTFFKYAPNFLKSYIF